MNRIDLLTLDFDGATYEPEHDQIRLGKQAQAVWDLISDGRWRTLREISVVTDYPEASISARLRDFRKTRFGEYEIERRRCCPCCPGIHEYRVVF